MDTGRGLESPLETRSVASKKHLRIYADGKVVEGGGGGPFGTSPFDVNIGGCGVWDAAGNWFTGAIDEMAIFHTSLSDEDVKAIAPDGITGLLALLKPGADCLSFGPT